MNCLQKTRFSRFALGACRRSAESSQNHPRSAPRDPESDPGGVKSGPGEPQERPGRGPGAARRHPKIGLNALWPPEPQERPGEAQEPPQRGSGSDFGASRASFGSFWGAPGTSFSSFFGAVQGRCACCHCVPQILGRRVPALALTIRRPPLAVRRACLRRRAFYASPCQATAPSLERFTHRAHSAGPLRPEVELTPSGRKSNPLFIDFRCFFKTILGSKWRPT